jgi:hypothetical protein
VPALLYSETSAAFRKLVFLNRGHSLGRVWTIAFTCSPARLLW